ncbi:MAG: hypothetical protein QOH65_2962 [Methylobacteriaceae bacterium]|jgi:hypothetical protein|nr:hypothetical protein [Methylobacteriaceae bacterium]
MTIMTSITPDWQMLRDEITAQALAACKKVEMALGSATEPPPLDLGEALEDVANEYLNLFDEISAIHRKGFQEEGLR